MKNKEAKDIQDPGLSHSNDPWDLGQPVGVPFMAEPLTSWVSDTAWYLKIISCVLFVQLPCSSKVIFWNYACVKNFRNLKESKRPFKIRNFTFLVSNVSTLTKFKRKGRLQSSEGRTENPGLRLSVYGRPYLAEVPCMSFDERAPMLFK